MDWSNKDEVRVYKKNWAKRKREINPSIREYERKYMQEKRNNPEFRNKINQKAKEYYYKIKDTDEYRERRKKYSKIWREKQKNNIEFIEKKREDSRIRMREKRKNLEYQEQQKEYQKRRNKIIRQTLYYKISHNIRVNMNKSLNGGKNRKQWQKLVGYSLGELMSHLEKQFLIGMSWNNYGEWHIDHIKPICSFNYKTYDDLEFKQCWSLNNLQPLWAKDNWSKGGKIGEITSQQLGI